MIRKINFSRLLLVPVFLFLITACVVNIGNQGTQLNPETLRLAWKVDTGAAIHRSPVTIRDVVVLIHGESEIQAFEIEAGELRWDFKTPAKLWPNSLNNTLEDVLLAGENGRLIAMTTRSGLAEWEITLDGEVMHSPLIDRYVVFAATSALNPSGDQIAELLAINASTGKILWKFPTSNSELVTPTRGGDMVYVGGNNDDLACLYAVDATEGVLRWKVDITQGIIKAIYANESVVVILDQQGSLTAIDATTGSNLWQQEFIASVSWLTGTENLLIFEDGASIQAMDIGTGDVVWENPLSAQIIDHPIIIADTLYTLTESGEVIAIDPQSGLEVWKYSTDSNSPAGMVITQDWIFVADENGFLYAYAGE